VNQPGVNLSGDNTDGDVDVTDEQSDVDVTDEQSDDNSETYVVKD